MDVPVPVQQAPVGCAWPLPGVSMPAAALGSPGERNGAVVLSLCSVAVIHRLTFTGVLPILQSVTFYFFFSRHVFGQCLPQ